MGELLQLPRPSNPLTYIAAQFGGIGEAEAQKKARIIASSYVIILGYTGNKAEDAFHSLIRSPEGVFGKRLTPEIIDAALEYVGKNYVEKITPSVTAANLEGRLSGVNKGSAGSLPADYGDKGSNPHNVVDLSEARAKKPKIPVYGGGFGKAVAALGLAAYLLAGCASTSTAPTSTYIGDATVHRRPIQYMRITRDTRGKFVTTPVYKTPVRDAHPVYAAAAAPDVRGPVSAQHRAPPVQPQAPKDPKHIPSIPAQLPIPTGEKAPQPAPQAPAQEAPAVPQPVAPSVQPAAQKAPEAPPAPPEPSKALPAQAPTAPQAATPTPAQVEQQKPDYSKMPWKFNQGGDNHARFRRGELKYPDLSDSVKAWFSLQAPRAELVQEGGNYRMNVTLRDTYKGEDLQEFRFGVKFSAGGWHFGLKPNEAASINLTEQVYNALRGKGKQVAQVIMYKVDGGAIQIHSSLNNERKPAVASKAPSKQEDVGGVLLEPRHWQNPSRSN